MANPLEVVQKEMEEGKKVAKQQIEDAFGKAKTELENRINIYGEKVGATPEEIAKLVEFKEKLLKQYEELKDSYHSVKETVLATARDMLGKFDIEVSTLREQQFTNAREAMASKTDPGRTDGIPDYEGYSLWEKSGTPKDENFNNKTRWTLTGYLVAMQMQDENMANTEFAKAKGIYEHSGKILKGEWDSSFDYKNLEQDMKLGPYLKEIEKFDLGPESAGLIAGYLMLADTLYPREKNAYREYLLSKMDKLKSEGKLNFQPDPKSTEEMNNIAKGTEQMKVLKDVVSPKEFSEKFVPSRERLVNLQNSAAALSSNLHMEFKDAVVIAFLAKKPDQFTGTDADKDKINDVTNRMKTEALAAFKENVTKIQTKYGEMNTALSALETGKSDKLDEKTLGDLHELMHNTGKELNGIKTDASVSFEDLVNNSTKLDNLQQSITIAESSLAGLQKKAEDEEESPAKKSPEKTKEQGKEKPSRRPGKKTKQPKETDEELPPAEKLSDLYEQHWGEAELVEGRFRKPEVEVTPNLKEVPLRDNNGKIFGQLPGLQALTIVDTRELARKVDEVVFVYVGYRKGGKEIRGWVEEAVLRYSDAEPAKRTEPVLSTPEQQRAVPGLEEERVPLSSLKPGVEIPPELGFLGNVYLEYVDVLKQLDTYGRNIQRYPGGLGFELQVNNQSIACRIKFEGAAGYHFTYGPNSMYFQKLGDFMQELNSGKLHQRMNYETLTLLSSQKNYQEIADRIGKIKNIKAIGPYVGVLEFERQNSKPTVNFRVHPHGQVSYSIICDNVGVYGLNVRNGKADNLNDFVTELEHHFSWAEEKKHGKGENLDSRKEQMFDAISNPDSYRNLSFQNDVGRVLGFKMLPNGVVSMYLDWGGGNTKDGKINPMLNVWVEDDGTLQFILNREGLGPDGHGVKEKVKDFAALMERVKQLRG